MKGRRSLEKMCLACARGPCRIEKLRAGGTRVRTTARGGAARVGQEDGAPDHEEDLRRRERKGVSERDLIEKEETRRRTLPREKATCGERGEVSRDSC